MSTDVQIQQLLQELFRSQRFAVMATNEFEQPFTSLMAFAAAEDLRHIVVLTERATRKLMQRTALSCSTCISPATPTWPNLPPLPPAPSSA